MRSNISAPRTQPGANSSSTMIPVRSSLIADRETECVTTSRPSAGAMSKCGVRTLPRPRAGHDEVIGWTTTRSSTYRPSAESTNGSIGAVASFTA
jgi:hypothetical protein